MIGRLVCGLAVVFFFIQLLFVDHLPIPGTRWEANDPWTGLAFVAAVALFFQWRRCRATRESFYSTRNLFWLVLFVYLSNFRWHGSDDLPASLLPFGLLRSGTFSLDRYLSWFKPVHMDNLFAGARGHWVSLYPVVGALLALPVYALPVWRGVEPTDHVLHQLEKISASLMCAAAVTVMFAIYRRRLPASWAFALALIYALGTNMFSLCSQALWQHGPASLMLVLALWAMDHATLRAGDEGQPPPTKERDGRAYWTACGAFAVLAIGARTSYAVFCAALAAAALLGGGLSALGRFLLGGLGPGLLLIAYWTWIVGTGRPAEFAIQTHLLDWHPHWKAIAGLLVSPARGLVFYAPAALFGAGGLIHALWTDFHSRYWQTVPLAAGVLCSFYLSTSYQAWIGGFSFGPRYLTDIVAVLFYFLPDALPRILKNSILRPLWWFAVAASVLCNATGAYATWNWERIADQSVWNWRAYPPLYVSLGTLVKSRE